MSFEGLGVHCALRILHYQRQITCLFPQNKPSNVSIVISGSNILLVEPHFLGRRCFFRSSTSHSGVWARQFTWKISGMLCFEELEKLDKYKYTCKIIWRINQVWLSPWLLNSRVYDIMGNKQAETIAVCAHLHSCTFELELIVTTYHSLSMLLEYLALNFVFFTLALQFCSAWLCTVCHSVPSKSNTVTVSRTGHLIGKIVIVWQ